MCLYHRQLLSDCKHTGRHEDCSCPKYLDQSFIFFFLPEVLLLDIPVPNYSGAVPSLSSPGTGPAHTTTKLSPYCCYSYAELHFFTSRLHYIVQVLRLQDCPCPATMIDGVSPTSTGVPPTLPLTMHREGDIINPGGGRQAGRGEVEKGERGACGCGTMVSSIIETLILQISHHKVFLCRSPTAKWKRT